MYRWIVFLHVLAALTFFLAHGTSAAVALRLKQEKEVQRIQALLEVSGSTLMAMFIALLVLLAAGITAGFMGGWWKSGWIWVSLALLIGIFAWMAIYSGQHYGPLRKAAGLPYRGGGKDQPAAEPLSDEEIVTLIHKTDPALLAAISGGVIAIILWLMMFKPF